jgi:predicted TIM-barrel fold metal-dependent hydrolase
MEREGVDKALLVQNPTIGDVNNEVQAALAAYPDRFAGAIQVDPLERNAPDVIRKYAAHPRHRTLKLEMSREWGWSGIHPGIRLDGPELRPLFETVSALRMKVIVDPGCIGGPGYQVEAIDALSSACPGVPFLIEHLGYLEAANCRNTQALARRLQMLLLARKPNVYLGFSAVSALLEEEYPCPRAIELLRDAADLVGADKILWGTDAPLTLRRLSYRQMIDVVRDSAPCLSDRERLLILGENAGRLFFGD